MLAERSITNTKERPSAAGEPNSESRAVGTRGHLFARDFGVFSQDRSDIAWIGWKKHPAGLGWPLSPGNWGCPGGRFFDRLQRDCGCSGESSAWLGESVNDSVSSGGSIAEQGYVSADIANESSSAEHRRPRPLGRTGLAKHQDDFRRFTQTEIVNQERAANGDEQMDREGNQPRRNGVGPRGGAAQVWNRAGSWSIVFHYPPASFVGNSAL